jgi:hypothetical protein
MTLRASPSLRHFLVALLVTCAVGGFATAESVAVKYRGPVDLTPFECASYQGSAVVERICYEPRERYVVVKLIGTYYHYCEVPATLVAAWRESPSLGQFYNRNIKGEFDCRVRRMPGY